ncbi:MAG: hypothetical protein EPO57_10030, partial [Chitinophagaceae bacterium]
MTNRSATTDWDMVEAQLPANWREIADEMKVVRVQRAQLNAKVTDIRDALRLVLHHAGVGVSLRATAALAAASGVVAVSWVAVHGWMKRLGPYVAALLREMVATSAFSRERWGGFEVIGGDATTVQNPGAKGTTARVHYALRLADLTPRHIEVTDEHGGETARRFRAEPGELWLLDRAYANPGGVESIRSRGGHVVVRYNRGTLPVYDKMGNRIDVMARLYGTFEREKEHQLPAVVHAGDKRITGRLCWLRVPADKVAEARRRAVRDAGGDCDADTLHAAEYVVVFTTVRNELSAAKILELYRARWQVELEFKRSKSLEELDRLPNFRPETIYTWICAKLLLQTIARKIASPAVAFPPGGLRWQLFPPKFDAH